MSLPKKSVLFNLIKNLRFFLRCGDFLKDSEDQRNYKFKIAAKIGQGIFNKALMNIIFK